MQFDGLSWSLLMAAAAVGATHALLGPDHYLPFLMLARARGWSRKRAGLVTAVCGCGHVAASLGLGGAGLALGFGVGRLEAVEGARGDWAAWVLVASGLAYGLWGIRKARRRSRGLDLHAHDGYVHLHTHGDRVHRHPKCVRAPRRGAPEPVGPSGSTATFWTLFAVFVLGPCEPLLPLFVLPASRGRWGLAVASAFVFGVVTILTMVGAVLTGLRAADHLTLGTLERWSHAFAGGVIAATGCAVLVLDL